MSYMHRVCAVAMMLAVVAPTALSGQAVSRIDVDYASFAHSDDASLVEIYMAVSPTALVFERTHDGFAADLPVQMSLTPRVSIDQTEGTGRAAWSDTLLLQHVLQDTTGISAAEPFVRQVHVSLAPGEYELRLDARAADNGGPSDVALKRTVLVHDYGTGGRPALSDLTLAASIARSTDRDDPFYKKGFLVRPSVTRLFGRVRDRLYYYAEAYGATDIPGSDGEYAIEVSIAEASRPQAAGTTQRLRRPVRTPDVLTGHFDVRSLPSGSYVLRIALLNGSNETVAARSEKLFVYNPDVERLQSSVTMARSDADSYDGMSDEDVETGLAQARIIADKAERRHIERLRKLDAKRRFLMDFWQKRDDRPETPINEFRQEFYTRVRHADDRYASEALEGWRTDRGRVVVKYGLPSRVEPHLYDRTSPPHEIWEYDDIPGEGQAVFVFADVDGFGTFELLHSTVTDERSLPTWRDELSRR